MSREERPGNLSPAPPHQVPRPPVPAATATAQQPGRIPADWFTAPPEINLDRDEILIIGTLSDVEAGEGGSQESARAGRLRQFREDTRAARMKIAREAEHHFNRTVSWGARIGDKPRRLPRPRFRT